MPLSPAVDSGSEYPSSIADSSLHAGASDVASCVSCSSSQGRFDPRWAGARTGRRIGITRTGLRPAAGAPSTGQEARGGQGGEPGDGQRVDKRGLVEAVVRRREAGEHGGNAGCQVADDEDGRDEPRPIVQRGQGRRRCGQRRQAAVGSQVIAGATRCLVHPSGRSDATEEGPTTFAGGRSPTAPASRAPLSPSCPHSGGSSRLAGPPLRRMSRARGDHGERHGRCRNRSWAAQPATARVAPSVLRRQRPRRALPLPLLARYAAGDRKPARCARAGRTPAHRR